ncbi:pollen receptor-like kinase 3 [Tripterygium wilfordii]|nr:pollen receptor-like kinase 3 [Tripterygium wilfordii]
MAAVRLILLQLLLIIFFSTQSNSQSDIQALLKLKKSFSPGALKSWDPSSSPCAKQWVGVVCFDGIVTGLHLSDVGLSGTIDIEALQEIRGLRTISFVKNTFSGPIPEFNKLGKLKSLLLSSNQFSSEIPRNYFANMASLKKVWLDKNKFTGKIPDSLMQLPHLMELHIEGNEFSGPIPPLKYPKLIRSIDLSHNNLEGEIPESFSSINASSFVGNKGLCGKPLETDCSAMPEKPLATGVSESQSNVSNSKLLILAAIAAIVVVFLVVSFLNARRRDDDFSILEKDNHNDVVEVHVPESTIRRPRESSRKGDSRKGDSNRRGSAHGKGGMGDLLMVNDERGTFGLPDLMKAAAEVLGNGGLGSAYKAVMANGLSVVVKRMREMNRLSREAFDTEMRRLGSLRHPNVLTPLAYHYKKEEKLVVSEYMPKSSLLYVLHGDRGICHAELNWPTRLKIVKGIARGMGFLHSEFASYDLPHGNLKSSNVLLGDDFEPQLNDYAFDPLTNPNHAVQAMFAYKSPEYVQYQQVSRKSDIYCFGIIILELLTGKFPSQYLSNSKGGTDVVQWVLSAIHAQNEIELIDPEIANNTNSLGQMVNLLQIGAACIESNPTQRLDMREAIRRIEEIQV